jgi:DnaJ family protein C protein 2
MGDEHTPYDVVNSFYGFWLGFKSWRDFPMLDEHHPVDSTGRDERRWMEKQNLKLRAGAKKEEVARVRRFVEAAMKADPRMQQQLLVYIHT